MGTERAAPALTGYSKKGPRTVELSDSVKKGKGTSSRPVTVAAVRTRG